MTQKGKIELTIEILKVVLNNINGYSKEEIEQNKLAEQELHSDLGEEIFEVINEFV